MVDFEIFFKFFLLISMECFEKKNWLISRDFLSFLCWFQWIVLIFFVESKEFFRVFNWFWEKTLVSWLISKEFFGFFVDFQRTFRFFVSFRDNFWFLGAHFRSFENDTVTPFKMIRLHFYKNNFVTSRRTNDTMTRATVRTSIAPSLIGCHISIINVSYVIIYI